MPMISETGDPPLVVSSQWLGVPLHVDQLLKESQPLHQLKLSSMQLGARTRAPRPKCRSDFRIVLSDYLIRHSESTIRKSPRHPSTCMRGASHFSTRPYGRATFSFSARRQHDDFTSMLLLQHEKSSEEANKADSNTSRLQCRGNNSATDFP